MFNMGDLLERLRSRPYDEVRYRWDKKWRTHTVTCCLGDLKASVMLTEDLVQRVRPAVAALALERFDEDLWEKISGGEGAGVVFERR